LDLDNRENESFRARHIRVRGVVQGVGFRPFVYRLALENHLKGFVLNTSSGVEIHIEGRAEEVKGFEARLRAEAPPMSLIADLETRDEAFQGYSEFTIRQSEVDDGYQLISPDIATCPECLKELFNPSDRRYRYPFINCTNCGPRFTIIKDIPYDRPSTTMASFTMCPRCREEYENPLDRRFHAQPNACPVCGPRVWLADQKGQIVPCIDAIRHAASLLSEGRIVAIKGLGGFLLACDATNPAAVSSLRDRKARMDKPFAVMVASLELLRRFCVFDEAESSALTSSRAPIVLLRRRSGSEIAPKVAPNNNFLGVMLPYTPLHHLLMSDTGFPLVMTSGNLTEEPIAAGNEEAMERLSDLADYFLFHDRDIHSRYDDSVVFVSGGAAQPIRRARSLAPYPIKLPMPSVPLLATGAQEKSSFCLARDSYGFLSQHIGDLDNIETVNHFERTIELYKRLFRVEPVAIAHDMHPDYLSTGYALRYKGRLPLIAVQHHHAHVAACMADNGIVGKVIGIAFDGSGYGPDGTVWGGEFLVADYERFVRLGHLQPLPMPGGELAIRKPYRLAIAYLKTLLGSVPALPFLDGLSNPEIDMVLRQLEQRVNTPTTSSCGRLFDAISALLGICTSITFEGQAAIELEMSSASTDSSEVFPYYVELIDGVWQVHVKPMVEAIVNRVTRGVSVSLIADIFHTTMASIAASVACLISQETGIKDVVLTGGCFQNRLLLEKTISSVKRAGLNVFVHQQAPCNDGGIALGQAAIAASAMASP
jgi:hydrogenase maturation protein HypF